MTFTIEHGWFLQKVMVTSKAKRSEAAKKAARTRKRNAAEALKAAPKRRTAAKKAAPKRKTVKRRR